MNVANHVSTPTACFFSLTTPPFVLQVHIHKVPLLKIVTLLMENNK